jgi:transglutaminase-like putative cysteine protease
LGEGEAMKWIKEKLIYIVLIFINFNFILRLLERGMIIKNFDYRFTSILFLIGVLIYWFYNYVLKRGVFRFIFTTIAFSAIAIFYFRNSEIINNLFNEYVMQKIIIVNDLIYNGDITYFYQYTIIITLIIPLITTLILWITFRFMKKFILMLSMAVVISLWFSTSYVVVKEHLFAYLFISSITFIIMSYIKKIRKYKEQGVKVSLNSGYILVYGVIISLMISKLTIMLPQEYKGKDLTSYGNYFNNEFASEGVSAINGKYGLSTSGYSSNEKKLGGPVSINYQEVFKVKSVKPYYLKGSVKSFYDGSKWSDLNENYKEAQGGNYIGTLRKRVFVDSPRSLVSTITIYPHRKFNTNTIFVPNCTFRILGVEGKLLYDEAPTVLSDKVVEKEYSVQFYKYADAIDTIEEVSVYKKKTLEKVIIIEQSFVAQPYLPMEYFLKPKPSIINEVTNEKLRLVERFEYSKIEDSEMLNEYIEYLQVPENITDRTYDLVMDITKDSKTSIEKVLEIKKYLTKNYIYELQVPVVPEGIEFLDYFLFQDKKGYCTYFNTAMTVMSRIAGVPARYVEGFKTPSTREDRGGLYSVSNADAHAWCEVLLGSNLWTVADASPTASEEVQRRLEELRKAQGATGNSGDVDTNQIRKPKNEKEALELALGEGKSKVKLLSDSDLNSIKILTTIILFILMRIIQVVKKRKKLFKSNGIAALYNYYLFRLATMRIVKEEYQGDLEFVKAIQDPALKLRMEILVQGAYEEFYGKHSVETLNNKEYYEFIENYLKDYQGRVGYLLNKYLGN